MTLLEVLVGNHKTTPALERLAVRRLGIDFLRPGVERLALEGRALGRFIAGLPPEWQQAPLGWHQLALASIVYTFPGIVSVSGAGAAS